MALDIGMNVIEVDGTAAPSIQPAATSIAGFLGTSERGVPNRSVFVSSPEQVLERFGRAQINSYLALCLDGFFQNGGREAQVVRVVGPGSLAATAVLDNREALPAAAIGLAAGFRGAADPGAWGDRLRVDVRDDARATTTPAVAIGAADTFATLSSLNGVRVGSVLAFVIGGTPVYRKITSIDPGTTLVRWNPAAALGALVPTTATITSAEFSILVQYRATPASELVEVERWRHLSMELDSADYALTRVNHALTGSRYLVLTDLSGGAGTGEELPAVVSNVPLAGGSEVLPTALQYLGTPALKDGLHALDAVRVQLVAIPDAHRLAPTARQQVMQGALDYCAARGDCMVVGSPPDRGAPPGVTPRARGDYTQLESDYFNLTVAPFSTPFHGNKVFGALYAPWIQVTDPAAVGPAPTRFVPPDGHVMGVYARTELERGIFKAPAGAAARVRGAFDVAALLTDGQHTDLVRNALVNGIRVTPNEGIAIAASRTLSTDTRWWFVNVRLLFNFVKSSLRDGLRFVRQEPHSEDLRRTVRLNVVTPFLLGLWRQGAFGSDPPEKVFSVKCDAQNNPASEVDLGNFKIEVYFYPVKPVETILIVVGQQPSGASAEEA